MAETTGVDAQHPWPWLDPFGEATSRFFNGRDDDAQALLRALLASPVCVLFGKSGLGKTSLLLAGLFPLLRARQLLPVALRRFELGEGTAGLSGQLLRALDDAVAQAGLLWGGSELQPMGDDVARLWERLHDRERPLIDAAGARWTPVFVLDQFEEVFTLQTDTQRQQQIFPQLGDLLENRVPPAVDARLDAHDALIDRIATDSQPYRVLVSLREDFLPELEVWTELIPRLGPNRVRLLPMSPTQALDAVKKTGADLVDLPSAQAIVDFLGRQAAQAGVSRVATGLGRGLGRDARQIEPALLSLVCASLNAERLALAPPGAQIDVSGLEARGARILDRFYDEAIAGLPEASRAVAARWVQTDLITDGGTRRPYPLAGIAEALRAAMRHLVDRRLLRIENTEQGDQVELVHDRLAAVAQQRARTAQQQADDAQRLQRETSAAEARLLTERASFASQQAQSALAAARQQRWLMLAALAAAAVAVAAAGWALNERDKAQVASDEAQAALKSAETANAKLLNDKAQLESTRNASDKLLAALEAQTQQAVAKLQAGSPDQRAEAQALRAAADSVIRSTSEQRDNWKASCPAGARVYPHVGSRDDLPAVETMAKALRDAGFTVPDTEVRKTNEPMPARLELRYFRSIEAVYAQTAAAALARAGTTGASVKYFSGSEGSTNIRPCHFELWLPRGAGR